MRAGEARTPHALACSTVLSLETRPGLLALADASHVEAFPSSCSLALGPGKPRGTRIDALRMAESSESEVIAQELSNLASKVADLDTRVSEVEVVIRRLEVAAATTAR